MIKMNRNDNNGLTKMKHSEIDASEHIKGWITLVPRRSIIDKEEFNKKNY